MSDRDVLIAGEIDGTLSLAQLGERLRGDGWRVDVGQHAVRLTSDRGDFKFEPMSDGGFILDDDMPDEHLRGEAQRMSDHLAARGLRHRIEYYEQDEMRAYFHHDWPLAEAEAEPLQ